MNYNLLDIFLTNTYSVQQARHRLLILKNHLESNFFNSETGQTEHTPEDIEWLETLPTEFYQQFTPTTIYQVMTQLEKDLKSIKPLTIYIAFDLPNTEAARLGKWIRKTFHPQMVFETRIDPSLLAGCALSWNGIYHDYSLRSQIEQNKSRILTSIKRFIR